MKIAERRLPMIAAAVEAEFEEARKASGSAFDQMLVRPSMDDSAARPVSSVQSLSLGEAYKLYMDDPTQKWSPATRRAYETCRSLVVAVIGKRQLMETLGRAECRELLEVLRFLPRNAAKRFPKLTPTQAAERSKRDGNIAVISAANANAILGNLSSFLNWAVNEELLAKNPARGLRLPDTIAKRDKRLPFSSEQLTPIFNAPLYVGCQDGGRGYKSRGSCRPRNARFWIPLIGLHTGARLGEICQLDVTDIRAVNDIPCMIVSVSSDVGSEDKRLKTGASDRFIPLHQHLLDCGILSFVEERRRQGAIKLFDDIAVGATGSRAVAFSKWFTQFLKSCGANRERTSFHSFRHNFRDELRCSQIEHDLAMLLGGWTTGATSRAVSDNYGSGHRVEALASAVAKLTFEDVDVGHLALYAR